MPAPSTSGQVDDLKQIIEEQTITMKVIAVHLSDVIAAASNAQDGLGPVISGFTLDQLNKTIGDKMKSEREKEKARLETAHKKPKQSAAEAEAWGKPSKPIEDEHSSYELEVRAKKWNPKA